MTGIATASALVLSGVLAWAAVAKLRGRVATAASFRVLRLPAPRALAVVVPVIELLVAVLLVVLPRGGAIPALVLLVAFSAFLASRIRAGATVGCGCFGTVRQRPPSAVELARNAGLATLAVVALWAPGPVLPGLPEVGVVATGVAVGAVALALLDVYVHTGRLLDNHVLPGPEGV